jgi:phage shock protein A
MWKRFVRAIKSLFGGLINSIEDPKLILEQNIRELNDQVPRMNENIATVKANVMLLQKEQDKYTKSIAELTSKIKSAINAGRDDIAETYALQLEKNREQIVVIEDQLEFAQKAYEKALQVKKIFMREKDRKIREAREALRASERAAWQAKIADTLEQFEVGGMDQTHDEMITRLNEKSARNEARMEIALDSIDTKAMEIEVDAERIRAGELVKQFKMEMNADTTEKAPLLKDQADNVETESGKSIGKTRTR